jgi:hypothetical protein
MPIVSWSQEEYLERLLKCDPNKLVSMIALDLRHHVVSMMAAATLLRQESTDLDDKDRIAFLNMIENQGQAAINILSAMLSYDSSWREESNDANR